MMRASTFATLTGCFPRTPPHRSSRTPLFRPGHNTGYHLNDLELWRAHDAGEASTSSEEGTLSGGPERSGPSPAPSRARRRPSASVRPRVSVREPSDDGAQKLVARADPLV